MTVAIDSPEWVADCKRWSGGVLIGKWRHWCFEWDGLPIDETSVEFGMCTCTWGEGPENEAAFEAAKLAAPRP